MAGANDALAVLYDTLNTNLKNYSAVWQDRVYATENIPSNVSRPYLVFFYAAGGEVNQLPHQDAELVISVKVVADGDDGYSAMQGAADISAALNDRGQVENTANPVSVAGSDWRIINITQMRRIWAIQTFQDAEAVLHSGHQFRFFMEEIV